MKKIRMLLLGSGGREHALAFKLQQSEWLDHLWIAPGNPGTSSAGTNVSLALHDFAAIGRFCREQQVQLVVVGPEAPLVEGLRDYLRQELPALAVVGPDAQGARLEGSKDFAKQFMEAHGIPTARARTFTTETLEEGLNYLTTCRLPIVLKADGLAAGKGVVIAPTHEEAAREITDMLAGQKFGAASARVLVEDFLAGIELSVFVLCDGKNYVLLPEAKDYKRIYDGDQGPNTGGMGAVSPVPFATPDFMARVEARIVQPTLRGLQQRGIDYRGFLFIGLMKVGDDPYVIEYNVRMGDPETQSVMMRIESDLGELLWAAANGQLAHHPMRISPDFAVTVVMAAGGYPGDFRKGDSIVLPHGEPVFHAGTRWQDGQLQTAGGRVLSVTRLAPTLAEARANAYRAVANIRWEGVTFRSDIGADLVPFVSSHVEPEKNGL